MSRVRTLYDQEKNALYLHIVCDHFMVCLRIMYCLVPRLMFWLEDFVHFLYQSSSLIGSLGVPIYACFRSFMRRYKQDLRINSFPR
ncbi:hypothetical protein QVD17_38974 [Tagetes erecta]|uniref:Uncharacterized protein n=1 Tax=Tagetes erecta TaxID=13708 RepID=A0AAD8JMQ3_TARER|nr:hypothetical protein QVD17_38974 [Tagetes erecta]